MTEPAAAEVDADPQRPGLVGKHVDVVIAAADRSQLLPRLGEERLAMPGRDGRPGRILEQRMVDRRVVGGVLPADPEADAVGDLVRQGGDGLRTPGSGPAQARAKTTAPAAISARLIGSS